MSKHALELKKIDNIKAEFKPTLQVDIWPPRGGIAFLSPPLCTRVVNGYHFATLLGV